MSRSGIRSTAVGIEPSASAFSDTRFVCRSGGSRETAETMAARNVNLDALGHFIRKRRRDLGLTQSQLGESLDWMQERISLLENGKYGMPSLPGLSRLASALQVPLQSVLDAAGYDSGSNAETAKMVAIATGNSPAQYTLQRLLEINATTLKGALNSASDILSEVMGAEKIDAFVFEPASNSLVAVGTSNTPIGRLQHASGLDRLPIANRGRTVKVYETGQSFSTGDAQRDPCIPIGVRETLGVQSVLAVPLRVDGQMRGVLVAESVTPNRFTDGDEPFFRAAGHWIGLIAHRAELNETVRKVAVEDARRVAADEVIATLAHDVGNYITPLKARIDMIRRRLARSGQPRDMEDVQAAARAISDMQQMIRRLLDVARLDQGLFSLSVQPVDLAAYVRDACEAMRPAWQAIEIRAADRLDVQADAARIRDVLMNLITNAIHHSPAGGTITVTAQSELRQDREWAVVTVSDQGPGIASDIMPHLFQRFAASGGSSGLGLGLYLARGVVEAHEGTVTVETSAEHGTRFQLSLPCSGPNGDVTPQFANIGGHERLLDM